MNVLVTGGAGFIGRWVVKSLLFQHEVKALDNLSNGSLDNIREFQGNTRFEFIEADVSDRTTIDESFKGVDLCIHLAAQINVQESLDFPDRAFKNNAIGTYNVLEACRTNNTKVVLVGTCMVYDFAIAKPITEEHPVKVHSPYAGSKAAAEEMATSYFYGYRLPVVIVRPFNTYGPFQKRNMEGGVVSIFINKTLIGEDIQIYGSGEQTRDLLYVEDCADFIIKAAFSDQAVGQIINGGTGRDISINDLAMLICKDKTKINHVPHHHPQAEIQKLVCDYTKAKRLLGWAPQTSLEEGIEKTTAWMKTRGIP